MTITDDYHIKHCLNCNNTRTCKASNQCKLVECPNKLCKMRMHKCKLEDHLNEICYYRVINCINKLNGCMVKLERYKLTNHLIKCPANVIECCQARNRIVTSKVTPTIHTHKLQSLNKILLNEDYEALTQYSNENRLKFNCYYHYLLKPNIDRNLDELKNKLNKVNSKIFKDIHLDYCVEYLHTDDNSCSLCKLILRELEIYRYGQVTSNLLFSDLLKHTYDYEQFVRDRVYADKAFTFIYNDYFDLKDCSNEQSNISKVLDEYDLSLEKSNKEILSKIQLNETFNVITGSTSELPGNEISSLLRHKKNYFNTYCNHLLRRDHYNDHYFLYHDFINSLSTEIDKQCPLQTYGCQHFDRVFEFYSDKCMTDKLELIYDKQTKAFLFKPCRNECRNDGYCYLQDLPCDVLNIILDKLDSYSLFNLSLTSKVNLI